MFPYERTTIDYGLEFVNDIESINLNFLLNVPLWGGVSEPWGPGAWFITDFENRSPAFPNS